MEIANSVAGETPDLLASGKICFSVFRVLALLIWLGSGFPAQRVWTRISVKCERFLPFLRIVALFAGPFVFLLWGLRLAAVKSIEKRRKRLLLAAEKNQIKIRNHAGELVKNGASREADAALELLRFCLTAACKNDAPELMLDPEGEKYGIRLKGKKTAKPLAPIGRQEGCTLIQLLKSVGGADPYETQKPQQGSFRMEKNGEISRVSFDSLGVAGGERVLIAIRKAEKSLKDLAGSGMDPAGMDFLRRILAQSGGMILVTGPKEAGKKTLLSLLLNGMDRSGKEICWIGNGTEPDVPGVTKLTTNPANMLTADVLMASGIVQNMDVIVLSSMDTPKVCEKAFQMASGGVLILAAMEEADAASAMEKLLRCGVKGQAFPALRALVGVRVLRRLCPDCAAPAALPEEYQSYFRQCGFSADKLKNAVGCRECGHSGYRGKTGVYDVIPFEEFYSRQLAAGTEEADFPALLRQENHGCEMLGYRGFAAAAEGVTSLDEVLNVIFKKER